MKALATFAQLPVQQQVLTLWEKGNYLLSRRAGRYSFSLYSVDDFFVEVCAQEPGTITQIILMDSLVRLDAYLKVISLKNLCN
jgi:hypothetical protein